MENRHLPILHNKIFLRVSNESRLVGRVGGENGSRCKLFRALGNNYSIEQPHHSRMKEAKTFVQSITESKSTYSSTP